MKHFMQKMTFLVLTIACYGNIHAIQVTGTQSFSWVDNDHKDKITGEGRTVEVQVWYPAGWTLLGKTVDVENAEPERRYKHYSDYHDLLYETPTLDPYPVVIVGHYNRTDKVIYSTLCRAIARNNFVVMTVTNGKSSIYGAKNSKVFLEDITFMLKQADNNALPADLAAICNFDKIGFVCDEDKTKLYDDRIKITTPFSWLSHISWAAQAKSTIHFLNEKLYGIKKEAGMCTIF